MDPECINNLARTYERMNRPYGDYRRRFFLRAATCVFLMALDHPFGAPSANVLLLVVAIGGAVAAFAQFRPREPDYSELYAAAAVVHSGMGAGTAPAFHPVGGGELGGLPAGDRDVRLPKSVDLSAIDGDAWCPRPPRI